jgi:hypothetical protein
VALLDRNAEEPCGVADAVERLGDPGDLLAEAVRVRRLVAVHREDRHRRRRRLIGERDVAAGRRQR